MTKRCTVCNKNVELIKDKETGIVFFHIVQATTIEIKKEGDKLAKRQSTSYLCQQCLEDGKVQWSQLIHYLWAEGEIPIE